VGVALAEVLVEDEDEDETIEIEELLLDVVGEESVDGVLKTEELATVDVVEILETDAVLLLLLGRVEYVGTEELLDVDTTEFEEDNDETVLEADETVADDEVEAPVVLEFDETLLKEFDDVEVGVMLLDETEGVDKLVVEAGVLDGTPPVETIYAPQAPACDAAAPTVDL
jgi:hypothetical protein